MHFITLLTSLFVVQPLVEYWLHRLVHCGQLHYHIDHHLHWSKGKYWSYTGDWAARGAVVVLAFMGWYTAALMLLKYELTHMAAHSFPGLRYLHRHHFMHHRDATCNFSFSAVWPDKLFGTLGTDNVSSVPAAGADNVSSVPAAGADNVSSVPAAGAKGYLEMEGVLGAEAEGLIEMAGGNLEVAVEIWKSMGDMSGVSKRSKSTEKAD